MALLSVEFNDETLKLVSILLILPVLLLYLFSTRSSRKGRKLPPGPPCLPLIGNLHMLGDLVYRSLKTLSDKYGPIMFLRLGSVDGVVISSSETAELVFKKHDSAFSARPFMAVGRHMAFNNQDILFNKEWKHLRRICMAELLSSKKVESHRDVREQEVSSMVCKIWSRSHCGKNSVNLSHAFYSTRYDVLWRMLAGKAFPDRMEELKFVVDGVSITLGSFYIGDYIPWLGWFDVQGLKRRMKKAHQAFDCFVESLLQQHADSAPSPDSDSFIDALLRISPTDRVLTRDCIKAILLNMFVGGTETTGATLEWTMSLLLTHHDYIHRLQKEIDGVVGGEREVDEDDLVKMKYLQAVVKESMRMYAVVPLSLPHECCEKVDLRTSDGRCYEIGKGTRLIASLWAIGRDSAVWDNAEEFRPERFMDGNSIDMGGLSDFKSIPFGAGRRVCPGIAMAVPTVLLVIARLFHEFDWTVDGRIDMNERMGITITKKHPLYATPKLRRNGARFRYSPSDHSTFI